MHIALYVNCFSGRFTPVGPFESEEQAEEFIFSQRDPREWANLEMKNPTDPLNSR